MSKFKGTLEKFDSDLWHYHFKVSNDIAKPFLEGERRVVCTINEQVVFHCALMHDGHGEYFINVNKEHRKKLGLNPGDPLTFELKADNSKYGLPMPEEMEELLQIDEEADHFFHALTPGKQRSLLFIIGKPKTSATRLHKALAITSFLGIFTSKPCIGF